MVTSNSIIAFQVVQLELSFAGRICNALRLKLQNEGRAQTLREHNKVPQTLTYYGNFVVLMNKLCNSWRSFPACHAQWGRESDVAFVQIQLKKAQKFYNTDNRDAAELLLSLRVEHVRNSERISRLITLLMWTEVCVPQRHIMTG